MSKYPKTLLLMAPIPPPYGGGEIMSEILINGLKMKNCFNIIHINTSDLRGNPTRGNFDLINIKKGLSDLIALIKGLLLYKPAIVYTTIHPSNYVVFLRDSLYIFFSSLFKAKVVCHLHGNGFFLEIHKNNPLFKFVLKKINTLIVLGKKLEQNLKNQLPVKNIAVVYNGIKPISQNISPKINNNSFYVLFIGNLIKRKGFFDLLNAIPIIIKEAKNINFLFAGEFASSQDKDSVLKFIELNNLKENVQLLGLITGEKKVDFFMKGNVLILPSYREGQPIVILEAMSAGLPIIATDVGSIAETIIDGKNGFIVPIGEPKAIAEKILLLYKNKELRNSMSLLSREIFEKRFSENAFLDNMYNLFNHIIDS